MRISPSQLALFHKCPLAWWRKYVRRLPEIRRQRKGRGVDVHALIDGWLRDGVEPADGTPEAALLERARPVLRPGPVFVEVPIELPIIEGVTLVGRMDALYPGPVPEIHDHKSYSASGKKYLASGRPGTKHWIGDDIQMLTYAAALARRDGLMQVVVRHNQIPVEDGMGPAKSVEALIEHPRLQVEWTNIVSAAAIMRTIAERRFETTDIGNVFESEPCRTCDFVGICGGSEDEEQYCRRAEQPERDDGEVFA